MQSNKCSLIGKFTGKKRVILTKNREIMFEERPITRCSECGEMLCDGDTAYLLGERWYCTSCVDEAMTICRRRDYYSEEDYIEEEEYDDAEG